MSNVQAFQVLETLTFLLSPQDVDVEPLPRGWDGGSHAGSVH